MFKTSQSLLARVTRLGAFLLFAQTLFTALAAHGVRAEVQDLMLSVGSQMMQVGERIGATTPRTLRVNGAQIRLRIQHTDAQTLDDVLDHFETHCRSRNGRFYEQLKTGRTKGKLDEQGLGLLDGVLRVENDESGAVACLDVGEERGSPESILERARRFTETGDAASFGDLRYVRAERRNDGGVFVVMMWTDGPLNIREMFPREGDAPGIDFSDLPRPPGARRILSAWEEGQAPALNMYESSAHSAEQLERHYRSELPKLGWEFMTPPSKEPRSRGALIMRDGVTVTLSHMSVTERKVGVTTIVPMDTRGEATVRSR